MEAIVEKTPRPKTKMRANFSRPGRWILRRVLTGRTMIQMSAMMWMELVAVWRQ